MALRWTFVEPSANSLPGTIATEHGPVSFAVFLLPKRSWKQAEASTPTSLSSGAQAAAGESHTSGTAQAASASPGLQYENGVASARCKGSRSEPPTWETSPNSKATPCNTVAQKTVCQSQVQEPVPLNDKHKCTLAAQLGNCLLL